MCIGVNLYTFGVALGPLNAEFGPLNAALGPQCFFLQICALQQYLYPCNVRDSCFQWLRASVFLDLVYMITVYRCYRYYSVISEHLFSWPLQRLSVLMSIFSVPQNKVAEIRG